MRQRRPPPRRQSPEVQRFSGTVHGIRRGKAVFPACGEGCPLRGRKRLREVCLRKRGREEANGTPCVSVVSVRDGCPNAGLEVVGGKGHVSFFFRRWITDIARHPGRVASRRGAGGERGKPLYTPYDPRTPLVRMAKGVTVVCRVPWLPLAAGGNRRASSRTTRGRYARLLRRSRCAGIASAPRLAGLVGLVAVRASASGEHFPHH